jgi:SMODS and SLOG-associating 2TM effector domain 3/SMODS and SLOG-associating 2TM effector domain 1
MTSLELNRTNLPGLYQSADKASLSAQSAYFWGLRSYLVLLAVAALISFLWPKDPIAAMISAVLFMITLGILVILKVKRPDDLWYNGRAVAESVKTMAWRWSMRSEPYENTNDIAIISKQFIDELKDILHQNRSISKYLQSDAGIQDPISETMQKIRDLPFEERLAIYTDQRINNQYKWYSNKSLFNRHRSMQWFWMSIVLHTVAIAMLLYRIKFPETALPIGVVSTAAGAVLTWSQSKKYNELNSSYSLATHEIVLIKGEVFSVKTEKNLSEFVVSSETAFSREHTQWAARRM